MSSEVKANKLSPATGVTTTLGDASDVFQLPASAEIDIASGATLDVNGTLDVTGATLSGLYETGTWTPVFAGSGTAGSFTYTTQVGHYTKIANVVVAQFRITISAISVAAAGYLYIQGLPENAYEYPGIVISGLANFTTGDYPNFGYLANGTNYIQLMRYDSDDPRDGADTHCGGTALTTSSVIHGSTTYRTSAT